MLSDSDIELAELAGAFIHELKNHISTLNLNLQILAEEFEEASTPRERRVLDRIQRLQAECSRMIDVSNDFNRFARLQNLETRPERIDALLGELLDFFVPTARATNIEVRTFFPADLPLINLDRDVFKQAILNLLLNALQAMPTGGELTIQVRIEHGRCVIRIIDTGHGMPPEVVSRVFKPYYTTKPGGSGLGLATTRKIIEAHGGTIGVNSEPTRGTCFTITLPVFGDEATNGVQEPTQEPVHVKKRGS